MSQIVASTYEILKKIGAGGAGIVYLGTHLRLGKSVVLKADKRTLATKPEVLRREVDALKDLSHTYIPQVYDFVVEGDTVYTVMDYIEGESLDKPLKRGEHFSQPQLIEWSCQLLEALAYLHSRPPHGILHSDIKPANIMLTPQGDIRLIDFNIALALGEEGTVTVGYSRGYASPEHYGLDYSSFKAPVDEDATEMVGDTEPAGSGVRSSTTRKGRKILLDVRSDIYSLGATLYHLYTGVRPAHDAKDVVPISTPEVSRAVADIINKAMSPDPADRYQTAAEMLWAFEHLHENDPRSIRHKQICKRTAIALSALLLAGGILTFTGQRGMRAEAEAEAERQRQAAVAAGQAETEARIAEQKAKEAEAEERAQKERERRSKQALAAVRSSEGAYQEGNIPEATDQALKALTVESPYEAQAQKALTDALGVYDLAENLRPYLTVELPSEALKLAISPEGSRFAALYAFHISVVDCKTGSILADLPAQPTATADFCFLDENRLLYAGEEGLTAYDIDRGDVLWKGKPCTRLALSGDRSRAAAVNGTDSEAVIYDTLNGEPLKTVSFGERKQSVPPAGGVLTDTNDALLSMNQDGSRLAASFDDGALIAYDLTRDETLEIFDASEYTHFEGGFFEQYLSFSAGNMDNFVFASVDVAQKEQTGGAVDTIPFRTVSDERGVCLSMEGTLVQIDPFTFEQREMAYTSGDIQSFVWGRNGYTLLSLADNAYALFDDSAKLVSEGTRERGCEYIQTAGPYVILASRETPVVQVLKLERNEEAVILSYDPSLAHSEARLSADGKTVMLYRFDRFYLFDREGKQIMDFEIPDAQEVYDQQFRRKGDESWLEVVYWDGTARGYSALDGSLLWENHGVTPEEILVENFETDRWNIRAPLHETAEVFDKESGEKLAELEPDSSLTYVTQVGEYVMTEYISAKQERYGLLLNADGEILARLPELCDVLPDGTLLFDDQKGNIRQSRIYSRQELIDLAGTKTQGG